MARNYSELSGEDLLAGVQKKNKQNKLLCFLGMALAAGLMIGGILMVKSGSEIFYGILMFVIAILIAYACMAGVSKANKSIAAPQNCVLFRKFGTPDMIAQRIAQESSAPLLDAKGALICDSFVMKHGDFETYVPLEEALWVYREEHRTNGIPDGVYLIIFDSYGEKHQYPFKFGKTGKEMMTDIMKHISEKAPECAFGYSGEARQYMLSRKKALEKQ